MKRAIVASIILAACTGLARADLTVGLMPAINSVPLVVADEMGYFVREGVRVRLVPFSNQLHREAALQTDAIDGTVSDLINAILGWSGGQGARVTSATEGGFGLLTSPDSRLAGIGDWTRLGSRRVRTGLLEASIVFFVTERILQRAGVDPSCVDPVPIQQVPVRLEMLLAGQVEAACLPEPLATLAASRGARLIGDSDGLGLTPGVLLFTRRAIAEKGREIAALYRAYDLAVREVNEHPDAHIDSIVAGCGFPSPVRGILRLPRFTPAFVPGRAVVADVAGWMAQKGLTRSAPAWDDLVDDSFVNGNARAP